jgi:hypothetical protein
MNISSIAASTPARTPEAIAPKPPEVKADRETGASRSTQPTVLAALPPGQGTRIDRLA